MYMNPLHIMHPAAAETAIIRRVGFNFVFTLPPFVPPFTHAYMQGPRRLHREHTGSDEAPDSPIDSWYNIRFLHCRAPGIGAAS